jgi:hypothetical protein
MKDDIKRFQNSAFCITGRCHTAFNFTHGILNYIETKAKCRHLKKLTCKGILRQVFIRVYRLVIQSDMLVFSTQLCELLPL